jgi:hypothetical protein
MSPHQPTARRRDRYQLAVTSLTGLATAGCLAATGWIAGQAAHTWAQEQPAPTTTTPVDPVATTPQPVASQQQRSRAGRQRVVLRQRPTRTRVTTQYVTPAAPVGGGGSVGSAPAQPAHSNPAPAPSSGS